jgi:hypothetical protein
MDMNRFPILFTLVALQVQFVYKSKTKLKNTIIRD